MFAPCRPFGRRDADALVALVDDRAERAQRVHVEVDRPVADAAAAEVGDERLAEQVQQRSAEQDRDAGCPGVRVDLLEVRRHRAAGVEVERARLRRPHRPGHAVHLEQRADDLNVADVGDIAQHARRLAEERRDHRLRGEVLRALDLDATGQRPPAADREDFSGQFLSPPGWRVSPAAHQKWLHPVVLTCVHRGG